MKRYNLPKLVIGFIILTFNVNAVTPVNDTVVIDDIRNLQINQNTVLTIDRRPVVDIDSNRATEQFGTGFMSRTASGFKARINYTTTTDGSNNIGDLIDMNLLNSVVGPVTSNGANSFNVLFVDLVVDADTILLGVDSINDIQVGDIVAASGIETDNGHVKVTRLEYLSEGSPYWLITGDIANLSNNGLDIGEQHVNTDNNPIGPTIILCENNALENGLKVIVDLIPDTNYQAGNALDALAIICYEEFEPPIDPPNSVFFNGDIEQVNPEQSEIVVDGITVIINENTLIINEFGSNHLEVGMNVSINGYEDEESSDVIAEFILVNIDDPFEPPHTVLLFGEASNVTEQSFSLQELTIQRNQSTEYFHGDELDLEDGSFIEVVATLEDPNSPNSQVIALEITYIDGGPPFGDYIRLEGEINGLTADHLQFMIQNETVEVNEFTFLEGTSIEDLTDGLHVFVEGFRNPATNIVEAEFIFADQGPTDPPAHVCLSGEIIEVNNDQSQFSLDNGAIVHVNADTSFIEGSQADLVVGAFVDIAGIVIPANSEIAAEVIFFAPDGPPPTYVFFNGFITAVATDLSQITVDDTVVNINGNTTIQGGTVNNLVVGIEVQIDGLLNSTTSEVDAEFISIPVTSVAASAPVRSEDIVLSDAGAFNGAMTIMGIEVHQNELTWDFNGVFELGLDSEQTVAFFGYQDNDGVVWASSVFSTSNSNPNGVNFPELFLQGRIDGIDDNQLSVLGVTIGNLEGAIYLDGDYQEISASEFFALVSNGELISINESQSYDRETNTLQAGVIALQDNYDHPPLPGHSNSQNRAEGNNISGSGIVTRVIEDVIFENNF